MSGDDPAKQLEDSIRSLEKAIDQYIDQVGKTKHELNTKINDLNGQLTNVNTTQSDLDTKIAGLNQEKEGLNTTLQNQTAEMDNITKTLREKLEEIGKLSTELELSDENNTKLNNKITELQNSVNTLTKQLAENQKNAAQTVELSTEISGLDTQIANNTTQIAKLMRADSNTTVDNQLLSLIAINEILKAERATKQTAEKTTAENLDINSKELEKGVGDVTKVSNDLTYTIQNISDQSDNNANITKVNDAQNIVANIAKQFVQTVTDTAVTSTKINDLTTQINDLKTQQQSCEEQKQKLLEEITKSTAKIKELENKITAQNNVEPLNETDSSELNNESKQLSDAQKTEIEKLKILKESLINFDNANDETNRTANTIQDAMRQYLLDDGANFKLQIIETIVKNTDDTKFRETITFINTFKTEHNKRQTDKLTRLKKEKDTKKVEAEIQKVDAEIKNDPAKIDTFITALQHAYDAKSKIGGKLPKKTIKKHANKKHANKNHTKKRFLPPLKQRRKRKTHKLA